MWLFRLPFFLLSLPVRLLFWVLGLVLWVVTLPLRLVFGMLGLIGFGRILQLGVVAGIGYLLYKLVKPPSEGDETPWTAPSPSEGDLQRVATP
jgi:hypothetical protein